MIKPISDFFFFENLRSFKRDFPWRNSVELFQLKTASLIKRENKVHFNFLQNYNMKTVALCNTFYHCKNILMYPKIEKKIND